MYFIYLFNTNKKKESLKFKIFATFNNSSDNLQVQNRLTKVFFFIQARYT